MLATSGSTLLGAAHLVMQPRAASHEGSWDGDGPSAYRGFLSDIFVSPAAKGTLEATFGKVWIGGMLLSEHPWTPVSQIDMSQEQEAQSYVVDQFGEDPQFG